MVISQESAAIRIQYWWRKLRKRLHQRVDEIIRWDRIRGIRVDNTETIRRLRQLAEEKEELARRYDIIQNMPPRYVDQFLSQHKNTVSQTVEKHKHAMEHRAARIIQRNIRKYYLKRRSDQYIRDVTRIPPARRVHLLAVLENRLATKKNITIQPIHQVQQQMKEHAARRPLDAVLFARRELLLTQFSRNINSLSARPSLSSLSVSDLAALTGYSSPLSIYKAELEHKAEMNKIEEHMLGLNIEDNS